ncbi:MAG: hypothetical protein IPJ06_19690 [Saprospiraceae bacterium]|nr:hypothetical protein [Saprospiraceae bacterium]
MEPVYLGLNHHDDTVVGGYAGRKVEGGSWSGKATEVYVWWNDTLRLQYDFSLEVGDTTLSTPGSSSTGNLFQPLPLYCGRC